MVRRKRATSAPSRAPLWIGLALGIIGLVWWLGRADPRELGVRALVAAAAAAVAAHPDQPIMERQIQISGAVARWVHPEASLRIDEMPRVSTPGPELIAALVQVGQLYERTVVEARITELRLEGSRATVVVDVRVAGEAARDLHAHDRVITAQLVEAGGAWRIVALSMPSRRAAEPEARP